MKISRVWHLHIDYTYSISGLESAQYQWHYQWQYQYFHREIHYGSRIVKFPFHFSKLIHCAIGCGESSLKTKAEAHCHMNNTRPFGLCTHEGKNPSDASCVEICSADQMLLEKLKLKQMKLSASGRNRYISVGKSLRLNLVT